MKNISLPVLLAVALLASAATIMIERMAFHASTTEAQASASLEGYQFTAQHRKDDQKDESFFFYNAKTGDIWVYEEEKPKEHYQVISVGQKLKKLN